MELYAWSGQRSAALRQYRDCARLLEEELGVAPDDKTQVLRKALETRRFPPPGELPPSPAETAPATESPEPDRPRTPEHGAPPPDVPAHNLPMPLTRFVGREHELARIRSLLQRPDCRLLSLVGPGGIGKTRLALESARRVLASPDSHLRYPHGMYFVPLAGLESPAHITPAIAEAIGFSFFEREGHPPEAQLLDYLAGKRLHLILDNLEHLLAGPDGSQTDVPAPAAPTGVRLLAELLPRAPEVTILATSRERLNMQGEWILGIEGMPVVLNEDAAGTAQAGQAPVVHGAVDLFLERARMVDAGFRPSAREMEHLVRICQLVEGWPLGIELAAAWVRTLPLADIEREIERGLDFLSTSLRDMPERHRSLRAVCDHSWRLLTAEEQAVYRKLSVFRGGFQRAAARAVTGASLPLLRDLVDKSLLYRLPGPGQRYLLHQVLQQYAAERLGEVPDEQEETRDRHSSFYATFLYDRTNDLKGRRQPEALDEIAAEVENVRVAWQWAAYRCRVRDVRRGAEALAQFWLVRRGFAEGERAFGQAAEKLESPDCKAICEATGLAEERALALGLVLTFQGNLAQYSVSRPAAMAIIRRSLEVLQPLGPSHELAVANLNATFWSEEDNYGRIEAMLRESLAIFEEEGDQWGVGQCLYALAYDPLATREVMLETLQQSLAVRLKAGDTWGVAMCHFALGEMEHMAGAIEQAQAHYARCLEIRRQIGDRMGIGTVLDYMGYVSREMGRYSEARRLHEESLVNARDIGDRLGIGGSLDNLGLVARDQGEYEEAERLLQEGLGHRRALATGWEESISLEHLGSVALARGDLGTAEERYRESLSISQRLLWSQGTALALAGLARVQATRGQDVEARKHAASGLLLAGMMVSNIIVAMEIVLAAGQVLQALGELEPAADLFFFVAQQEASIPSTRAAAERALDEMTKILGPATMAEAQERAVMRTLEQAAEEGQAALSSA
jgi:predicted ATPase